MTKTVPQRPHAASISIDRQLAAIERVIEDLRWARNDVTTAERETFHALRAAASGLRAFSPSAQNSTRKFLGSRVAAAVRDRPEGGGWDQRRLIEAGLELISRWAVVEQALERFEQELER